MRFGLILLILTWSLPAAAKDGICLKDLQRHAVKVQNKLGGSQVKEKVPMQKSEEEEFSRAQNFVLEQVEFGPNLVQLRFDF